MKQYAKFVKHTLEDETVCPFCDEGVDTSKIDVQQKSEKWHCHFCDNDYIVWYADDEHNEIQQITTRNNVELTDDESYGNAHDDLASRIQIAIDKIIEDGENGYIEETLSWAADVIGISKCHKMRLDNDLKKLRKDLANMVAYCRESYNNEFVISVLNDCLHAISNL